MTTAHFNNSHADQIIYDKENKIFPINSFTHTPSPCFVCIVIKEKCSIVSSCRCRSSGTAKSYSVVLDYKAAGLFVLIRWWSLLFCKSLAATDFWSFKKTSPTLNTVHHINSHHALNNSSLSSYPITLDWVTLTVTSFCTTQDVI